MKSLRYFIGNQVVFIPIMEINKLHKNQDKNLLYYGKHTFCGIIQRGEHFIYCFKGREMVMSEFIKSINRIYPENNLTTHNNYMKHLKVEEC